MVLGDLPIAFAPGDALPDFADPTLIKHGSKYSLPAAPMAVAIDVSLIFRWSCPTQIAKSAILGNAVIVSRVRTRKWLRTTERS